MDHLAATLTRRWLEVEAQRNGYSQIDDREVEQGLDYTQVARPLIPPLVSLKPLPPVTDSSVDERFEFDRGRAFWRQFLK